MIFIFGLHMDSMKGKYIAFGPGDAGPKVKD
jgi:hypothetical protein